MQVCNVYLGTTTIPMCVCVCKHTQTDIYTKLTHAVSISGEHVRVGIGEGERFLFHAILNSLIFVSSESVLLT